MGVSVDKERKRTKTYEKIEGVRGWVVYREKKPAKKLRRIISKIRK